MLGAFSSSAWSYKENSRFRDATSACAALPLPGSNYYEFLDVSRGL